MKLPKEIFEQHIAVLGKTGSGKTSTAKLFIEQAVGDGARVCVLDPIKSDWWGLTSSADGKKPGLPFHILGGPHGHVPLHESAGKAIGEVVANGALPLSIIDMADFKMGGLQTFFCNFAESLIKKNRGHVYLVLEEAHEFAPKEMAGVKGENMGVYWAKKLATAGRSKGLRIVLLTQRTQALHNALLGSCETMIVHRMTAPADQKPAIDWLKANASKEVASEVAGSLSSLKTGDGWLCSGEAQLFERIKFPRIHTFDNTSGQAHARAVKTSPVDADKLRSIIGAAVEEAKANDPAELKKQIADLKRQLTSKAPVVDEKATERAVATAVAERDRHWKGELSKAERAHGSLANRLTQINQLSTLNGDATIAVSAPPEKSLPVTPTVFKRPPEKPWVQKVTKSGEDAAAVGDFKINKTQQRILDALAWYESIGEFSPSNTKIGAVALIDPTGGYFSNTVGPLSSAGLVDRGSGTLSLTDTGRAAAKPIEAAESLEKYHKTLKTRVLKMKSAANKTGDVLDAIIAAGGQSITNEEIGAAISVDHTGGYFSNLIGPLVTAGMITRKAGVVTPTDVLFPEGLV